MDFRTECCRRCSIRKDPYVRRRGAAAHGARPRAARHYVSKRAAATASRDTCACANRSDGRTMTMWRPRSVVRRPLVAAATAALLAVCYAPRCADAATAEVGSFAALEAALADAAIDEVVVTADIAFTSQITVARGSVTVRGACTGGSSSACVLDGQDSTRLFYLSQGVEDVTFENLELTGGFVSSVSARGNAKRGEQDCAWLAARSRLACVLLSPRCVVCSRQARAGRSVCRSSERASPLKNAFARPTGGTGRRARGGG